MKTPTVKQLERMFGVTYDTLKAGFILPDGKMLDLSGGKEYRSIDHYNIFPEAKLADEDWESEAFSKLVRFTCDTGVIRFGAEPELPSLRNEHTIYASMCKKPTENQVNTLKQAVSDVRLFNKGGGDVELRMETIGTKDLCYIVVPNPTQESVDKFVKKCFKSI